jgi:hypothetical protein
MNRCDRSSNRRGIANRGARRALKGRARVGEGEKGLGRSEEKAQQANIPNGLW